MPYKSLQLNSFVRYGSGLMLGLALWTVPAPLLAHVGHDNEFAGGDAAKVMQPIEVDANKAATLGIKTEVIAKSASGATIKVPSTSLVDANGQKLVYIQEGASYKSVSVQIGSDSGDVVEIKEGNLAPGNKIVTQGATLLYSQALRGKASTKTQTSSSQPTAPHSHSSFPWMWVVTGTGVVVVGGATLLGLKGKSKSIFKD
jgi:hypothetical protein